jgi:hypothetical protein
LARFPLCDAHLEIRNDPERPGGAQAALHLDSWLFPHPRSRMSRTTARLA